MKDDNEKYRRQIEVLARRLPWVVIIVVLLTAISVIIQAYLGF